MKYVSTRGGVNEMSFCDAAMMGLASDGGLLVPKSIPDISADLSMLSSMNYNELALEIMGYFIDDIPKVELERLVADSYKAFDDPSIAPLVKVDDFHVMELFHGPTLAFKDVALQFLGNLFDYILRGKGGSLNILGATSGDTGGAAIAALRGKKSINIFIMFPEGKISKLQENQMTSVLDSNVQNIAVQGSFDDCQLILKSIFSDLAFKEEYQLGAVNSVNWTRVMAQIIYYFSAYAQLGAPDSFQVAVPTGNFGNIFAGYLARRMGLPIERLILATNENDILHRFFSTGRYEREPVQISHSPAMDIQVASNFERYLYYEFQENAVEVREFMSSFQERGIASVNFDSINLENAFTSGSASNESTLSTISEIEAETGYLLDPHTAVGVMVGKKLRFREIPLVCLATAHPAKFDEVMTKSIPNLKVKHDRLEAVRHAPPKMQP